MTEIGGSHVEGKLGRISDSFALLEAQFGFVPSLFRAQREHTDLVAEEAALLRDTLFTQRSLTRAQKECVLLMVAVSRGNSYWFALQAQALKLLGLEESRIEGLAKNYQQSSISPASKALLTFALKVVSDGVLVSDTDFQNLAQGGFSGGATEEATLIAALGVFLCSLADALEVKPDFAHTIPAQGDGPRSRWNALNGSALFEILPQCERHQEFTALRRLIELCATRYGWAGESSSWHKQNILYPTGLESRQTAGEVFPELDPDAQIVDRVKAGDVDAFEELVHRHGRRIYRMLVGILASADEARDAMQDTFLKAFQNLGRFEGRSKFSTWLVSIATNNALQRMRERKPIESLDDSYEDSEGFRPRQVQAWTENPEQVYSQAEIRSLVETAVMKLPMKYRVVVLLRDLEQVSTEDAAAALELAIPALKARLLRGRLMLREALAPHFGKGLQGVAS